MSEYLSSGQREGGFEFFAGLMMQNFFVMQCSPPSPVGWTSSLGNPELRIVPLMWHQYATRFMTTKKSFSNPSVLP